nr:MAG TPA: hypothetical protein [Caudoviricetes sp.]
MDLYYQIRQYTYLSCSNILLFFNLLYFSMSL